MTTFRARLIGVAVLAALVLAIILLFPQTPRPAERAALDGDEQAWVAATQSNTHEDYLAYIKRNRNGKHVKEAGERASTLVHSIDGNPSTRDLLPPDFPVPPLDLTSLSGMLEFDKPQARYKDPAKFVEGGVVYLVPYKAATDIYFATRNPSDGKYYVARNATRWMYGWSFDLKLTDETEGRTRVVSWQTSGGSDIPAGSAGVYGFLVPLDRLEDLRKARKLTVRPAFEPAESTTSPVEPLRR